MITQGWRSGVVEVAGFSTCWSWHASRSHLRPIWALDITKKAYTSHMPLSINLGNGPLLLSNYDTPSCCIFQNTLATTEMSWSELLAALSTSGSLESVNLPRHHLTASTLQQTCFITHCIRQLGILNTYADHTEAI